MLKMTSLLVFVFFSVAFSQAEQIEDSRVINGLDHGAMKFEDTEESDLPLFASADTQDVYEQLKLLERSILDQAQEEQTQKGLDLLKRLAQTVKGIIWAMSHRKERRQ